MTPEQAWEHVKALDHRAECITPYFGSHKSVGVQLGNDRVYSIPVAIDWPEGVDRWPPVEVEYREPRMPEDYGKEIEVRDLQTKDWQSATLGGFAKDYIGSCKWLTEDGHRWCHARIRVTPEVTPEATTEESSAVPTCKESSQVNPVAWREVQK